MRVASRTPSVTPSWSRRANRRLSLSRGCALVLLRSAPVAQPDRVSASEAEGCGFDSRRAHVFQICFSDRLGCLPVTASILGWRSKFLIMEIRRMGIAQQESQYIVNTLSKLRITPCSTLFPACYACERAPYSHVPNPLERACMRRETRCLRVVHILMTDSSVDLKKPSIHRGCEQRGFSRLHLASDVNYSLHPCHHPLRFLNL